MKTKLLLDSCIIDRILKDDTIFVSNRDRYSYYICSQAAEQIAKAPDENKRAALFISLCKIEMSFVLDGMIVCGYSRFDCARLGAAEIFNLFEPNDIVDGIIAETAHVDSMTVLTCDKRFNEFPPRRKQRGRRPSEASIPPSAHFVRAR